MYLFWVLSFIWVNFVTSINIGHWAFEVFFFAQMSIYLLENLWIYYIFNVNISNMLNSYPESDCLLTSMRNNTLLSDEWDCLHKSVGFNCVIFHRFYYFSSYSNLISINILAFHYCYNKSKNKSNKIMKWVTTTIKISIRINWRKINNRVF